jgi:hypothetical protein
MVKIKRVNFMGRTSRVLVLHRVRGSRPRCFMIGSAMCIANVLSSMVDVEDGLVDQSKDEREQAASLNLHNFVCHSTKYFSLRITCSNQLSSLVFLLCKYIL